MSSNLIGGNLRLDLNQPIKWVDFRFDPLLADTMLTKLYTTDLKCSRLCVNVGISNPLCRELFFV
jgi:hypothetical protein